MRMNCDVSIDYKPFLGDEVDSTFLSQDCYIRVAEYCFPMLQPVAILSAQKPTFPHCSRNIFSHALTKGFRFEIEAVALQSPIIC